MNPAEDLAELADRLDKQAERLRATVGGDNVLVAQLQQLRDLDRNLLLATDLDDDDYALCNNIRELLDRLEQHQEVTGLLQEEAKTVRQVLDQHRKTVGDLEERLDRERKTQRAQQSELDKLRETSGSDRSALSEATERIADLEEELAAAAKNHDVLGTEFSDRGQQISGLRYELSEAQLQAEGHRQEAEKANEKAQQARDDLIALERDLPGRLEVAREAGRRDAAKEHKRGQKGDASSGGRGDDSPSTTAASSGPVESARDRPLVGLWTIHIALLVALVIAAGLLAYHLLFQSHSLWFTLPFVGLLSMLCLGLLIWEERFQELWRRCPISAGLPMVLAVVLTTLLLVLPMGAEVFWIASRSASWISSVVMAILGCFLLTLVGGAAKSARNRSEAFPFCLIIGVLVVLFVVTADHHPLDRQVGDCVTTAELPALGVVPLFRAEEGCANPQAVEIAGVGAGDEACSEQAVAYLGDEPTDVEVYSSGFGWGWGGLQVWHLDLCWVAHSGEAGPVGAGLLSEEVDEHRCLGPAPEGADTTVTNFGEPPCRDDQVKLLQLGGGGDAPAHGERSAVATAKACRRALETDRYAWVGRVVEGRLLCGVADPVGRFLYWNG